MGFFSFREPEPLIPNEINVITPQKVLVSLGGIWLERILHKGADGTLWVHGEDHLEWIELRADGYVQEADAVGQSNARRWREMPQMLAQPFVTIRREDAA